MCGLFENLFAFQKYFAHKKFVRYWENFLLFLYVYVKNNVVCVIY